MIIMKLIVNKFNWWWLEQREGRCFWQHFHTMIELCGLIFFQFYSKVKSLIFFTVIWPFWYGFPTFYPFTVYFSKGQPVIQGIIIIDQLDPHHHRLVIEESQQKGKFPFVDSLVNPAAATNFNAISGGRTKIIDFLLISRDFWTIFRRVEWRTNGYRKSGCLPRNSGVVGQLMVGNILGQESLRKLWMTIHLDSWFPFSFLYGWSEGKVCEF